jgi:hypothetical protein
VVEAVPYRPIPPGGASYMMTIPPVGLDGRRVTVNTGLTEDETLWHLRSAWNVAALNCMDPIHAPILEGYGAFLKQQSRKLAAANTAIDKAYRQEHGSRSDAIKAREAEMTQVYNYFALPPTLGSFCNAALQLASEYMVSPPEDLNQFAVTGIQRFEAVFDQFFREYEQYRIDSAAWDAQYGERFGASQPGYVAVHMTPPPVDPNLTSTGAVQVVGEVVDEVTGARIPVLSTPATDVATPVVQPVPEGAN